MTAGSHALVRLQDSQLTLAEEAEDVRGRKVVDCNGEDAGRVDGLLVDEKERLPRFLEVALAGSSALITTLRLVPVETIARIAPDSVHIATDRLMVAQGPMYEPGLDHEHLYVAATYGYYDCPPFWWPASGDLAAQASSSADLRQSSQR